MAFWPRCCLVGPALAAGRPAVAETKLAFVVGINAHQPLGPDAQFERAVADADAGITP